METLSTRNAAIRMATLIVSVCVLEAALVLFTKQSLVWASWTPALIPLLIPLTVWELFSSSQNSAK